MCLVYALLILVYEFVHKRQFLATSFILVVNYFFVYLIAEKVYEVSLLEQNKLILNEGIIPYIILIYPLIILLSYYLNKNLDSGLGTIRRLNTFCNKQKTYLIIHILFIALIGFSSFKNLDQSRKTVLKFMHYNDTQQWTKLLNEGLKLPTERYTPYISNMLIRALYHTNKLGNHLFTFPMLIEIGPEPLLLLKGISDYSTMNLNCSMHTLLDIGEINLAEKNAYELMENVKENPTLLYNQALICLGKNNNETAKVFINNLKNFLHLSEDMKELIAIADSHKDYNEHKTVRFLRSAQHKKDYIYYTDANEEKILQSLLQHNPKNKMAFEYLMTYYLLTLQADKIIEYLPYLHNLNYKEIPRHYQEAIFIYMNNNQTDVSLDGYQLDQKTTNSFNTFMSTYTQNYNNVAWAEKYLEKNFGSSYYFYYVFGYTGLRQ
jgi:hypothetical protein